MDCSHCDAGSTPSSSTTTARTISTTTISTTALTLTVMTYPTSTAVTNAVARTVTSKGKRNRSIDVLSSFQGTSCNTPTSTLLYYSTGPSVYTFVTYSYTASSSGTGYVEFGFSNPSSSSAWYLDDVSLQDVSASNVEMLTNRNFETGDLTGWDVACTSNCLSLTGGVVGSYSPRTGQYSYEGACGGYYDFLRQTFPKTIGHVYTLTFWYKSSGRNRQEAFVNIF